MPKNGEGVPNFITNPATPSWPPHDALLERCRYAHRPQPHYFAYMLIKLTCKYFILNSRGGASGISDRGRGGGQVYLVGGIGWVTHDGDDRHTLLSASITVNVVVCRCPSQEGVANSMLIYGN